MDRKFKINPLAIDHGDDGHTVCIGGQASEKGHGQRTAGFQIAAASLRGVGHAHDPAVFSVSTSQFHFIGNRSGGELIILDAKICTVTGLADCGTLGHALIHPVEFELDIQHLLIVQFEVVLHIPPTGANREKQMINFLIRTRCGIQDQIAGICGQIAGLLTGSCGIRPADDLGILRKSSCQTHSVNKYTLRQIIVLHREAFRLVRPTKDGSGIPLPGLPDQFQIQVQIGFTLQYESKGQFLMDIGFLHHRSYQEAIFPGICLIGQLDGKRAILSDFVGGKEHSGDIHIPGIGAGKGEFIFQPAVLQLVDVDGFGYRAVRRAGDGVGISTVFVPDHHRRQIQLQFLAAFFTLAAVIIAFILFAVIGIGGFLFCRFGFFRGLSLLRLRLIGLGFFRGLGLLRLGRNHAVLIGDYDIVQFADIFANFQNGYFSDRLIFEGVRRLGMGHIRRRKQQTKHHGRAENHAHGRLQ